MAFVRVIHKAGNVRARYKVEGLYRSEFLKKHLELGLSQRAGIRSFFVSDLTGNVLVFFNSGQFPSEIQSFLEKIIFEYRGGQSFKEHGVPSVGNGDNGPFRRDKTPPLSHLTCPRPHLPKRGDQEPAAFSSNPGSQGIVESFRKIKKLVVRAEEQKSESWHLLDGISVLSHFGTEKDAGLSSEMVAERLKRYGPNILPEAVPRSRWKILADQFKSLPVGLLCASALISIFTGGVADAIVIMGVVGLNGTIGYATESHSEKIINSLKSLIRPSCLVRRGGRLVQIGAEQVVPGDFLILRPGTYVAADARLLEAYNLSVDESALTGESMPVLKTSEPLPDGDIPLADRTNMVYTGTLVTGGQGLAVVTGTGRYSEIGKIQLLIGEARPPETPMERQLKKIGSQLVLLSGGVCGLVFVIGMLRGYGFLQMLKASISLAVAAVPEGLPAVATTTLALGIRNMQRHHALIRHLDAVETLGSVQTICLDKTGTITMNRMSVAAVYLGSRHLRFSDNKFMGRDGKVDPYASDDLLRLIHISVLCNESEVFKRNGEYVVNGTPTENALIDLAIHSGVDVLGLRERFPRLNIHHRSENRNFMVTLHKRITPRWQIVATKGSPMEVLSICRYQLKDGQEVPLTDEDRAAIETQNEHMAGEALRVLGIAYAQIERAGGEERNEIEFEDGLVWVGLVGLGDPVRSGVKELIESFHRAGINTVMITGDQTPTAYAIGKALNLSQGQQLEILDSTHLTGIDPEVMKALCERVHVFSRVSPAHKLQIVHALQRGGKVVAMTGDGINDGPALKAAEIGIAMGNTGTDVAREVADVVLEDDHLETMVIAISQGRTIYNNIRKTVHYLLATNLSEIMVMFAATAGGLGQPINAMQLLWINLISDIFPGLALALEPPEPDVLSQPPRDPKEPIIGASDFKRIALEAGALSAGALGAYGFGLVRYGMGAQATTLAFMSLSVSQIVHALSCRSKSSLLFEREGKPLQSNPYLHLAVGGTLSMQAAALMVPGLRSLLGITPIRLLDGLVIGASALWPFLFNETTKSRRIAP
jgi:Ca2+-transporting ATPase